MLEAQAVNSRCVVEFRFLRGLVLRDHLLSASGVTGEGKYGEGCLLRDHSRRHKRKDRNHESRCVTARICGKFRVNDCIFMRSGKLRNSICPARRGAVCRGSVDDPRGILLHKAHCLLCRRIRQAEEGNIRRVDKFLSLIRVFSLRFVN